METIDTSFMNAEEIRIAYAKRREEIRLEFAKKNKLKLVLHLWTKEEYKENSISKCSMFSCLDYLITHPETLLATTDVGDSFNATLSKKIFKLSKDILNLDTRTLAMRFPSLSYSELPEFINNTVENTIQPHNYICFNNDVYKYIDIHLKHLLLNGNIQIYIDGINYTENPTAYNINVALITAINATDNSLKFRNAISSAN